MSTFEPVYRNGQFVGYILTSDPLSELRPGMKITRELKERVEKLSETQREIDETVLSRIKTPKKDAEIERRLLLAEKIGVIEEYENGTVMSWTRMYGRVSYSYAAIKAGGKWYVTGDRMVKTSGWDWEDLFEWMITSESTVDSLRVVETWNELL